MIDTTYEPKKIETAMQTQWQQKQTYQAQEEKQQDKFYCLAMFPYPSGELHVGHMRNYTIADMIARHQRLLGNNVLHPIGWDAFGLPAENAAIKHKLNPATWTKTNINRMRDQLKQLGLSYDWQRELNTSTPDYYHFEQWLFLRMYEKGLVYRKKAQVNWDPVDQTVLANEQVIDGKGWRSGATIERVEIEQWFIKITAYADELLEGLDELDWPKEAKVMQTNWIGRSQGLMIEFKLADQSLNRTSSLAVFTTRADTLYGVSYIAIATQHPLATQIAEANSEFKAFIALCRQTKMAEADLTKAEKLGKDTGLSAIHPLTGEAIPIWMGNYVLNDYGCQAVMGVPAHDQRDFDFAQKYQLSIRPIIEKADFDYSQGAWTGTGILINSQSWSGLEANDAKGKITDYLLNKGLAKLTTKFRLHDWGVSRQRYWGTPIPFIHCRTCGLVAVADRDLPVILPTDVNLSKPCSPLKQLKSFYQSNCPKCGEKARRETDTFDTFLESSWYYLRFTGELANKAIMNEKSRYWLPVDCYIGGIEHAIMHLLYARFIHKVLRDLGIVAGDEPFKKLLTQGMVLKDGAKMSKSKGNVVSLKKLIEQYGADTLRFFIIFAAPPRQSLEWSERGVEGAYRFLQRVFSFAFHQQTLIKQVAWPAQHQPINWQQAKDRQKQAYYAINSIIKQADYDMQRLQLNTLASACMKLLNVVQTVAKDSDDAVIDHYLIDQGFSILLRLLHPISPHISEYLWQQLGYQQTLGDMKWPVVDQQALKKDSIDLAVQINGKYRGRIKITANMSQTEVETEVKKQSSFKKYLDNQKVVKVIFIASKVINFIIKKQ